MRNKIILQPKDLIQLHVGLKIENVGEKVIEFEIPRVAIYPVAKPELISIVSTHSGSRGEER